MEQSTVHTAELETGCGTQQADDTVATVTGAAVGAIQWSITAAVVSAIPWLPPIGIQDPVPGLEGELVTTTPRHCDKVPKCNDYRSVT